MFIRILWFIHQCIATLMLIGMHFFHIQAQTLPSGFTIEKIADNLNPVGMTIDPFGRIWIVEKQGRVLIWQNGTMLDHPFIELSVDDFNERGLMGIALHPDYVNNGYVYLYFTVPNNAFNRVIRVTSNGDTAIPGSEKIIMDLDPLSGAIHNGGAMLFDDQGYLFIATGEGGKSADAQSLSNLNGKILRLHDDGSIPADNPFVSTLEGKYQSIYSYGLRNPFSMTFDYDNKKLYVSDVGQGAAEEINIILPGKNYGWPFAEGYFTGNPPIDYQDPFYAYSHEVGCAIVGAAVLGTEASLFPQEYRNAFYFADYCKGFLKFISLDGSKTVSDFGLSKDRPLAIHFDTKGDMYLLTRSGIGGGSTADNTQTLDGAIWKIRYTGEGKPFIIDQTKLVTTPKNKEATFYINVLGNAPLEYHWYKNGVEDTFQKTNTFIITNSSISDNNSTYHCIVINTEGADTSETMILHVIDSEVPQPIIIFPYDDLLYKAGDTIRFLGRAIDEGQIMPESALTWTVEQHHNEHAHPVLKYCCVAEEELILPYIGETSINVFLRITLQATDTFGLSAKYSVDIFPDLSAMKIDGPEGLKVNVDGTIYTLPATILGTKRITRIMDVPSYQLTEDSVYIFQSWENGSLNSLRSVQMGDSISHYTIHFKGHELGKGQGLKGEYYNDPEFDLDGTPNLIRIDSTIKFNWGNGSPHGAIEIDNFTVRWSGYIQPIFDEEYTFYVFSDDGCRLTIGDSIVINEWHTQSAREHKGTIFLKAGKKYPIVLDYLESKSGSIIEFRWSSLSTPRQIVPKRQLYLAAPPASIVGDVFIDNNQNGFFDIEDTGIQNVPIILYTNQNKIADVLYSESDGRFRVAAIDTGQYYIHFNAGILNANYSGILSINESGYTTKFNLAPSQLKIVNAPFSVKTTAAELNPDQIKIFPNPFSQTFSIEYNKEIQKIDIYDDQARILYHDIAIKNLNNLSFDPGVYMIKIQTTNGIFLEKIICIK